MTEGAPGAEGGFGDIIRDVHSAPANDLDSSDDSLRERVLKVVDDRDVRTFVSQQEGEEGRGVGAPLTASGEVEAQPAGSSQIACAPSSIDAIPGIGIRVRRTRYFLLLQIDGFFMWQFFGHVGPLRDSLGLTVQKKMHYFLRPGLKEFLEFSLINFEVIFWTIVDTKMLEPHYQKLLEVCPALGENRATLGRRWCNQSTYLNPITRKYDNYLKRLDRVLTDTWCLGKYCHLRDDFLLVDPLAYRNVLNNPFNAYHPTMYHRKSKEEERDAPIPYFRHSVQPFLQGLLDSRKTVLQYCAQNDRHSWRRLFPGNNKFSLYK